MSAADRSVYFSKISSAAGGSVVGAGRYQPGRKVCSRDSMADVYVGRCLQGNYWEQATGRLHEVGETAWGRDSRWGSGKDLTIGTSVRQITYHWHSRECGIPEINEFLGQLKEKKTNQTTIPRSEHLPFPPTPVTKSLRESKPAVLFVAYIFFFLWREEKKKGSRNLGLHTPNAIKADSAATRTFTFRRASACGAWGMTPFARKPGRRQDRGAVSGSDTIGGPCTKVNHCLYREKVIICILKLGLGTEDRFNCTSGISAPIPAVRGHQVRIAR